MTYPWRTIAFLWIFSLSLVGCKREKQIALPPVSEAPHPVYQGPSSEVENQSTSTPIAVETLPKPASTTTDVRLNIPLPASKPPSPKPRKISLEPKRDDKPPPTSETKILVQAPSIQLALPMSESERSALTKKINDRLESAKTLIRSVNESHLNQEQRTNLAAILDFIKKSEEAMKHGEFTQSLVLAEKASTLSASLSNLP